MNPLRIAVQKTAIPGKNHPDFCKVNGAGIQFPLTEQVHLPERNLGIGFFHVSPTERVHRTQCSDALRVIDVVGHKTGVQTQRVEQLTFGVVPKGNTGRLFNSSANQSQTEVGVAVPLTRAAA